MCIYDVYGPFSCPHGRCFTVLAQAFAVGSWVTSMMALTSCFYVSVRPIPEEGAPEMPKEGFGWLGRQIEVMEPPSYGGQCTWYSAEERALYFDAMWNAGFAMALITCILGLVVMSTVLCTCCVAFQLPTFDGLYWTCAICFVAQALSFLSWGSDLCTDYECTWSSGTGMNLTAAMMWVWAANMIKSFPEALPPRKRNNRKEDGDPDDDDDGRGDVYLSNRSMAHDDDDDHQYRDNDALYRDDEYGNWDNANVEDEGDGYYDDDGNWVANDPDAQYSDNNPHDSGYSDYDNESGSNWAEESDADIDTANANANAKANASASAAPEPEGGSETTEPASKPASKRKQKKRIPRKKKKGTEGVSRKSMQSSQSSFDNDDWDDERGSFRY